MKIVQQVIGDVERLLGKVQQLWGCLSDNHFAVLRGRQRELLGRFKIMQAVAHKPCNI